MYCSLTRGNGFPLVSMASRQSRCTKLSMNVFIKPPSNVLDPSKEWNAFGESGRLFFHLFYHKASGKVLEAKSRNFSNRLCHSIAPKYYQAKGSRMLCGFYLKAMGDRNLARSFSDESYRNSMGNNVRSRARKALPWLSPYKNGESSKLVKARVEKSTGSWEESANIYFSNVSEPLNVDKESKFRMVDDVENCRMDNVRNYKEEEMPTVKSREASPADSGKSFFKSGFKQLTEKRKSRMIGSEDVEHDKVSTTVEEWEDDVNEPINDPRWVKIRSKYNTIIDREVKLDKPEVVKWNKLDNWGRKIWKEAHTTTIPKIFGEGVYGVSPVLAALTIARREFYTLYVQEGLDLSTNNRKRKDKKGIEKALRMAEKIGLTVKETSKHDLNMVVENRPHQGLVLDASPLQMVAVRELDPVSDNVDAAPLWVALDEVTDPQNLGAIIRSAYFFGASGIVLCAKNSAPLSGVVSKASAGSLELIELRFCKNMMQFLTNSAENGWRVLGGSVSLKAVPLNEVATGTPTILVLGSEGCGLRPLVEKSCTTLVKIPGSFTMDTSTMGVAVEQAEDLSGYPSKGLRSFLAVESLNVSVAAGVLLYHLVGNNSVLFSTKKNDVG